jgi:recombination protein RecA
MANTSRAVLESVLRSRKLDVTLTTALPPLERFDGAARVATGIEQVDETLRGGLRRGSLSEIVGAHSSGRTTVLLSLIAAATRRGEIAALIDTSDRFDVASAGAAGIDLTRLLWVRGHPAGGAGGEAVFERTVGRALKALNLVLQAGGFGVVAIDLVDVPAGTLQRMPPATWLRVQRAIEGSETACVIVASQSLGRGADGVTLALGGSATTARWVGPTGRSCLLGGIDITGRVVSPRQRAEGMFAVASAVPGIGGKDGGYVRCALRG